FDHRRAVWLRGGCAAGRLVFRLLVARADHHEAVSAGLGAPHFAWASVELAHRGIRLVARKAREALGLRIELEDGVGAKVADPHLVLAVDIDRVSVRRFARQLVNLPARGRRVVDAEIAGVPLAHPQPTLRVWPHPPRADARRLPLDHGSLAGIEIGLAEEASGQRDIIDCAVRGGSDAVGADAFRRFPHLHLAGLGIEPAINTGLPGEPDAAASVECGGVEIGVGAVLGKLPVFTSCVAGSTLTIALSPPSVIHAAPSGPMITPCGADPSPSGMRSTCPVSGLRRPSTPARWPVYQTVPSGAGATSWG